jgi:hypothetical protein
MMTKPQHNGRRRWTTTEWANQSAGMTPLSIVTLLGILAIVAALLFYGGVHPGWSAKGMDCIHAYSQARTLTDSAMVDQQRARVVDDKEPGSLRCGDLRRAHALPGQAPALGQPNDR